MASLKRKRSIDIDTDNGDAFSIVPDNDGDIDIASALTGTRATQFPLDGDNDDEELDEFIHDAIVKRNIKGGTDLLKKIKSKGYGKADVGGGSFQSMGRYHTPASFILSHTCQVSIRFYFVRSPFRDTVLQPRSSAQLSPPFSPPPHAILSAWLARAQERPSHT